MTETIEKIESLPESIYLFVAGEKFGSFVNTWIVGRELQALADTVKAQADVIREMREALEHYADESFWDDPHPEIGVAGTLYVFEDEFDGAIPGHQIAQAVLDKWKEGK